METVVVLAACGTPRADLFALQHADLSCRCAVHAATCIFDATDASGRDCPGGVVLSDFDASAGNDDGIPHTDAPCHSYSSDSASERGSCRSYNCSRTGWKRIVRGGLLRQLRWQLCAAAGGGPRTAPRCHCPMQRRHL
jgi:hypothetical protein